MKRVVKNLSRKSQTITEKPSSKDKNTTGFTIIEVLIVLSIAGLIMLIVFQAIPSLTRASRNGRRKADVTVILDAVSHYMLKDSGNFPLNCGGGGKPACNTPASTSNPDPTPNDYLLCHPLVSTNTCQATLDGLTYYTYSATNPDPIVVFAVDTQTFPNPGPSTNTEQVQVYDYEKCDPDGDGRALSSGADYTNVVALYALEGGSGTTRSQCQNL